MKRRDKETLRSSWGSDDGQRRLAQVLERLRSGGRLEDLPLPPVDGRVDLRGIPLGDGKLIASAATLRKVDLSGSDLSHARLTRMTFEDCVFDYADLRGLGQWSSTYVSCSFAEADCSDASFGADGADFRDCSFTRTKFLRASFIRPRFEQCTFADCKLKGVDFNMSGFVACRFSGLLADVRFNGYFDDARRQRLFGEAPPNPMRQVDFSDARFEYVSFDNHCDLSTVIPPRAPGHVLVPDFRRCIDAVEAEAADWSEDELRRGAAIWIPLLRNFARAQESYILSKSDFRAEGPAFADAFFALFEACSRAVA